MRNFLDEVVATAIVMILGLAAIMFAVEVLTL
jgi:hypothetical protein